jgi:O-antigen/teichoic acid export membrane protein
MAREYLRFAFPLALPISLIAAIMFVDKAVIGAFWGSMEVGYYAAAYGLFFAFVTVGTLMNTLMLSHMTRLYSKGKTDDMNNTLWTSQRYLAAFLLPVAAFLVIFGNDAAVILFGRDFAESGPIISLLALVIYPMTLGNIMSHVLLSTNRNVSYGRVSMIYAVSVIVMFFLFVPSEMLGIRLFGLGAAGAALSLLIGSLLLFFMVSVILKRTESLRNYPKLILYVIAALAVGAVLYMIREYAHIGGILWFVVLGLLSIIVYMGILIVTREFKRDDFKFIMDTINPKNLYDDIKEEMKDD